MTLAVIHVLLVEDEHAHIKLISRSLTAYPHRSYKLHVASTLQEARLLSTAVTPNIAFIDYKLPDGSGLVLLNELAKPTSSYPVVVLTSYGNEQLAVEAMKLGALDYMTKSPTMFKEMPHIIQRTLREWQHIQAKYKAEQGLRDSEQRFRALIESASESIIIINEEGRIISANAHTEKAFGYTQAELSEMTIEQLLPDYMRAQHRQHRYAYLQDPSAQSVGVDREIMALRRDGSTFPVEIGLSYSREHNGYYVMAYVMDISDRKKAEQVLLEKERLQIALEKEQELSELKNRFMSMISHEFRNPLAVIILSASVLRDYYARLSIAEQHSKLSKILEQAAHLEKMLDDLKLVMQAERGYLEFAPHPVNLGLFFKQVISEASDGRHVFDIDIDLAVGTLLLDANLLRHILSNLLSNAVKYSPDGSRITCCAKCAGTSLVFTIADEGRGIPPNDLKRLFTPYHRASNVGSVRGTGLGLKIVYDCVHVHNGSIEVESTVGKGTTFTVSLPLRRP